MDRFERSVQLIFLRTPLHEEFIWTTRPADGSLTFSGLDDRLVWGIELATVVAKPSQKPLVTRYVREKTTSSTTSLHSKCLGMKVDGDNLCNGRRSYKVKENYTDRYPVVD